MPYCPKCRYEYRPEIAVCPDCNERLVSELPADAGGSNLVCVASFPFEPAAQMARLRLEQHGIQSVIFNETMAQTDIILVFADGGVKLMVPGERAAEARKILEAE